MRIYKAIHFSDIYLYTFYKTVFYWHNLANVIKLYSFYKYLNKIINRCFKGIKLINVSMTKIINQNISKDIHK